MKGVKVCSPNTLVKFLGYAIDFGLIEETEKGYVVKSLYCKKFYWRAMKVDRYIDNNKYWKDASKLLGKELKKATLKRRKKLGKATTSLTVKNFINIIQALRLDAKLASCDYMYHKMAIRAGKTHDGYEFTLKCNPKKLKRLTSNVDNAEAYDNGLGFKKIAKVMGVCRSTAINRMKFYCDNGMYKVRHNRKCIEELYDKEFCKNVHGLVNLASKAGEAFKYTALAGFREFDGRKVIITNNNSILVYFANSYTPNEKIRDNRMNKYYYKKEVRKEFMRKKHAKKQNEENNNNLSSSSSQTIKQTISDDQFPY